MRKKHSLTRNILPVVITELLFVTLIQLGFVAAKRWDTSVLLGSLAGFVIAMGYYLSIVLVTLAAEKKAQNQDVHGGQALVRVMYPLRMLLTFGALLACCISKVFNILALALPMLTILPAILLPTLFHRRKPS